MRINEIICEVRDWSGYKGVQSSRVWFNARTGAAVTTDDDGNHSVGVAQHKELFGLTDQDIVQAGLQPGEQILDYDGRVLFAAMRKGWVRLYVDARSPDLNSNAEGVSLSVLRRAFIWYCEEVGTPMKFILVVRQGPGDREGTPYVLSNPEQMETFIRKGFIPRDLVGEALEEALRFQRSSPYGFTGARNKSKRPTFLSQNAPQELTHHDLYIGHSSEAGYALDRNKDLQNVFNNSKMRGIGKEALVHAIKNGATTLDAFDGKLPILYKQHGFVVTGRMPFSDEYAPEGWDYEKYGRPDVVFMVYRGGPRNTIEQRIGRFPPYEPDRRLEDRGRVHTSYDEAKRVQRTEAMKSERMMR